MPISILHTNDTHGTLAGDRLEVLRALRENADFYFDTGDAIKTGNLGIPFREEPVWGLLDQLRCDASVLGNRETHILESAFHAKLSGATHPILVANLRKKDGTRPLPSSRIFRANGLKVGVFGVMVPMVTERMKTQAASAYLWDPPIEVAAVMVAKLRQDADVVIALTHIGHREDVKLAESVEGIDVILGGHSHTLLHEPQKVRETWICQGGSHTKFAGVYQWSSGVLTGGLVPLDSQRN
jgi:2',3'-cyclic-nucleotide 2'-phosphodiesterase (5'-nucleotidase family)